MLNIQAACLLMLASLIGCNARDTDSAVSGSSFPPESRLISETRDCPGADDPDTDGELSDTISIPDGVLVWGFDVCPELYGGAYPCYAPELSETPGDELVLSGDELVFTGYTATSNCGGGTYTYTFIVVEG